jgi:hypothetical protein
LAFNVSMKLIAAALVGKAAACTEYARAVDVVGVDGRAGGGAIGGVVGSVLVRAGCVEV